MKKVLIVEDEDMIANALKVSLEAEGFIVFVGKNGIEGLEYARREKPDLILTDIIMPQMDGKEMLQEMRKDEKLRNIPVVVLTNVDDDVETIAQVFQHTPDYLVKANTPVGDVVARVKTYLD